MPAKPARLLPASATILERSRGVFYSQWEELLQLKRVVLKSNDLDDIHDLRVASRRFRAALELYYPLVPKGSITELRKCVRNLTRILGGLRNVDEALLFFKSRCPGEIFHSSTLYPNLTELRIKEMKHIEKSLKAFDHMKLDRLVRETVAGLKEEYIAENNRFSYLAYFSDVSIRMYVPIHQLLVVSTVPENRASRHALRIAIKKWRYFFEIIAKVLDRNYTTILELLKDYQSILGQMNDIVEFENLLRNMELPHDAREPLEAALKIEDIHLLNTFSKLVEEKPLSYTFLI